MGREDIATVIKQLKKIIPLFSFEDILQGRCFF